jgi:uncharacterized membrane protein YgaE (UPF0421/DUF939 family)
MSEFGFFVLGVLSSLAVNHIFFRISGDQLKREAENLRHETEKLRLLQELTIFAMTNPKADIEPKRDEAGNIVGLKVNLAARSMAVASAKASPESKTE